MKRGNPIKNASDRAKLAPEVVNPVKKTRLEKRQGSKSSPMGKVGCSPK